MGPARKKLASSINALPFMRRHDDGTAKNPRLYGMQTNPRQPCDLGKRSKKVGKQKKRPNPIK